MLYGRPTGWLYSPVRMRNSQQLKKISQFSKVATFLDFILLIRLSFPKIETNNFNSDPCFFNLVKLGTTSPAAHLINCVDIGRSQKMTGIIRGLSSGKHFVKLNKKFLRSLNYKHGKKIYRGALKSRYWNLLELLLLLFYTRISDVTAKIFYFLFFHDEFYFQSI